MKHFKNIFQTHIHYSKRRKNVILLPDMKQQLKVRSFHPWPKYKTTSEVLDLAFIELSEGFQLSDEKKLKLWKRIDPKGVKVLPYEEFSTHSMSIYLLIIW